MLRRAVMSKYRFIDIGANLTDSMYRGVFHGKQRHQDDLSDVLQRAVDVGVEKSIITVGHLEDVPSAIDLCKSHDNLYCTVGCHPTRCNEFKKAPGEYFQRLLDVAAENREHIVAVGECGLDYDREHFCPRETQKVYFEKQFELARVTQLPMFLHMRNSAQDFVDVLRKHRDGIVGGVVHCFTGTVAEAEELVDLNMYIGVTGCSLKTEANVETVRSIPSERLMIETDAPWCEIKNTHAGSKFISTHFPTKKKEKWERGFCVKSRNEPCHIVQVLEVIAGVRNEDCVQLADVIYENTMKLFFNNR